MKEVNTQQKKNIRLIILIILSFVLYAYYMWIPIASLVINHLPVSIFDSIKPDILKGMVIMLVASIVMLIVFVFIYLIAIYIIRALYLFTKKHFFNQTP